MSTHNICFPGEIRKILCGYPLLSVTMTFSYLLPDFIKQYSCRYGQKVLTFFFFHRNNPVGTHQKSPTVTLIPHLSTVTAMRKSILKYYINVLEYKTNFKQFSINTNKCTIR